jgi:hypothetical protein
MRFSLPRTRGCSVNYTLQSGSVICRSSLAGGRMMGKSRHRWNQTSSSMMPRRSGYRATFRYRACKMESCSEAHVRPRRFDTWADITAAHTILI